MPIYEYECEKCGTRVEALIRKADDVPRACAKCGSKKLVRAFSAFSVAAAAPKEKASSRCAGCPSGSCPYSGAGE